MLCRRTGADGLAHLVSTIEIDGGSASGFLLNAVDPDSIEDRIAAVEREIGAIEVLVFDLGAQIGNRSLAETTCKALREAGASRRSLCSERRLRFALTWNSAERGRSWSRQRRQPAAVRGNAGQHAHATAMGGRRMLCQSLNAEFALKGIQIAHIIIDGSVDAPDTLGKMLGAEAFQKLREGRGHENDGLLLPERIAETYVHIAHQHRSAWSHELDLRSFSDLAWWNY